MWENLRVRRLRAMFDRCGEDCEFHGKYLEIDGHVSAGDRCIFENHIVMRTKSGAHIELASQVSMGEYTMIEATKGVQVGEQTGIGPYSVIRDTNHFVIGTDNHWRMTPHIAEPIVIGSKVLIDARCYITPGVTIEDGAIVAPHSVVTKSIGPLEIWAGNPARKIAHRLSGPVENMLGRYRELLIWYGCQNMPEPSSIGIEASDNGDATIKGV